MSTNYTVVVVSRVPAFNTDNGLTFNTKYRVTPGSSVVEFIQRLAGGPRLVGERVVFARPHADPECPWLYCQDITSEPLDDDYPSLASRSNSLTSPAFYASAMMVSCVYRSPKFDQPDGGDSSDSGDKPEVPSPSEVEEIELSSNSWEFSAQSQKIPGAMVGWNDDASPVSPSASIDKLAISSGVEQAFWPIP